MSIMKIKNMFKLLVGILTVCASSSVFAQQQIMYTQYMFNQMAINPAYTGSHESISVTGIYRNQWSGLEGAPTSQTFSIHSPTRSDKVALGFVYSHDKITVVSSHSVYGTYAYRIPFANDAKLSLGIQAGGSNYNNDLSRLTTPDMDPSLVDTRQPFAFNFGAGAYYYTDRFYAGLSMPNMVNNLLDNEETSSRQKRHFFGTIGYLIDLNRDLKLRPNMLIKGVEGAPLEFDLNANLLIKEVLWVGLSWRSMDSFDALLELQLLEQFRLGYAYDFATTTDLNQVQSGSHELMLNYRFRYTKKKIITPRYF